MYEKSRWQAGDADLKFDCHVDLTTTATDARANKVSRWILTSA